jgi:hypothetical protein
VRRVWAGLLVMGALLCSFMWCAEPWQRSGYFRIVPEWVFLALGCLSIAGLALMAAGGGRKRWRRALAIGVLGLALLGGMRGFFGTMARSDLLRRIQHESTLSPGIINPDDESKPLSAKLVEALEGLKIGAPNWLKEHAEKRGLVSPAPTESLIAKSRWFTRRALAEAIIRDDALAAYLMGDWKRLFPAIIGPDVDLQHRREWMEGLDALRRDESLGHPPRITAMFCMALIVLTDPPEFETWRVTVRDAMLGWKHPLPAGHEAMWMRTVDTLLAPDPPETWTDLAKPLIATPESFRYAMLAPVRGVAGHFEVLKREFEEFERRNMTEHGFALWHGVGESLKHWPDRFDPQQTERMRNWRRDVLFRWLMDHSRGTRQELSETRGRVLLELTPRQQSELAASAAEWARMACEEVGSAKEGADLSESRAFLIFHLIFPYLNEAQQAEAGRQLIPVMLRPDLFKNGRSSFVRLCPNWVELLWKTRPSMSEKEKRSLRNALAPWMERMRPDDPSYAFLLMIDAWSDTPALTPEKWLALAWHVRSGWLVVSAGTPLPPFDPFRYKPLRVPPVSGQTVESFARIMDYAWSGGTKGFDERYFQGLNGINTTAPIPRRYGFMALLRINEWRQSGLIHTHSMADLLKMDLHLLAACRI